MTAAATSAHLTQEQALMDSLAEGTPVPIGRYFYPMVLVSAVEHTLEPKGMEENAEQTLATLGRYLPPTGPANTALYAHGWPQIGDSASQRVVERGLFWRGMARATNASNTQEHSNTTGSSLAALILVGRGRSCLQMVRAQTVQISLGAKETVSNVVLTLAANARR